jgi:hypothetical protein
MYYVITGRTTCGKRIEARSDTWDAARQSWDTISADTLFPPRTMTLWRVDPHHRRHRMSGYRFTRNTATA